MKKCVIFNNRGILKLFVSNVIILVGGFMEKRDLYDKNRNKLGIVINKDDKIPDGCYIMVVLIIMQNSRGDFLIQKRSELKGDKWAFTGGHPKSGESSLDGIISEVREELGIDISSEKIKLMKSNIFEKVIGDIYYVNMEFDLEKVVLQEEEVSDVMIASYEEILNMIKSDEFFNSHGKVFMDIISDKDCKKMIKML